MCFASPSDTGLLPSPYGLGWFLFTGPTGSQWGFCYSPNVWVTKLLVLLIRSDGGCCPPSYWGYGACLYVFFFFFFCFLFFVATFRARSMLIRRKSCDTFPSKSLAVSFHIHRFNFRLCRTSSPEAWLACAEKGAYV